MKSFLVLAVSILAVVLGFPQDISVVRPNHYLQQGAFAKEQHLLPQSFFTPGQQVEDELKSLPASTQTQAQVVPASGSGDLTDSYANIGGRLVSGTNESERSQVEYGESVPKPFSNLEHDNYAFYHGHKSN